jgi:hypothetical protein
MHLPTCLGLGLALAAGTLSTRYEPGLSLRIETETSFSVRTESVTLEKDGVEIPAPDAGRGQLSTSFALSEERRVVQVDAVRAAADGRPTEVRRTFESLAASMTLGDGQGEASRDLPLDGATLELQTEADGAVRARIVGGDARSKPALLEGHRLDLALDALLPVASEATELGDGATWTLGASAVRRALSFDATAALFPPPARAAAAAGVADREERQRPLVRLMHEADWSGEARLVSRSAERDGRTLTEIAVEIRAAGDFDDESPAAGVPQRERSVSAPEAASAPKSSYEFRLEGRLFFDEEQQRPVVFEIAGDFDLELRSEITTPRGDRIDVRVVRKGTLSHHVRVAREDSSQ